MHVLPLSKLESLKIDGFWENFDKLPHEVAAGGLQEKLGYLRDRFEDAIGPLL